MKTKMLLAAALLAPTLLYAGTGAWTVSNLMANGRTIGASALAVQAGSPATAYASGYRVWKTIDGGTSWQASDTGITNSTVEALAIDPSNPSVVYAGSYGVFKSTDAGANWTETSNGFGYYKNFVNALAIDPAAPSTVYAGFGGGSGLWKSGDGGANWVKSDTGMVPATIKAIAIDPKAHQTVYAATELNGLWKSSDGGANWTAAGLASEGVYALAIDPANNLTVYAAGQPSIRATDGTYGVFKSTDGGASWTPVNNGLPSANGKPTVDGRGLAIDASSGVIYLATYGSGAYRSSDGGASWTAFNDGIPVEYPGALTGDHNMRAIAASSGMLYAGSDVNIYTYGSSGAGQGGFSITGSASGGNDNLSLSAQINVAASDIGKGGNIYVAAQLPSSLGGGLYLYNGAQWVPWTGGGLPVYFTGALANTNVSVLSGLDVRGLVGTSIVVGYGQNDNDLLANQKYAVVYTIH
ncbi:MAG: WD40/YVTN/BNR-like repeat-containing protein [Burkholderiales bacterium]